MSRTKRLVIPCRHCPGMADDTIIKCNNKFGSNDCGEWLLGWFCPPKSSKVANFASNNTVMLEIALLIKDIVSTNHPNLNQFNNFNNRANEIVVLLQ